MSNPATAAAQPLATLLFTAAMQKNLSVEELAQATGYSIRGLSLVMSLARTRITTDSAQCLADFLGLSPQAIQESLKIKLPPQQDFDQWLSQKLFDLRNGDQPISQTAFCEKHGFNTSTVGYWLHDGRLPKPKTAARLATALNVEFAELASIIVWGRFKGEGV